MLAQAVVFVLWVLVGLAAALTATIVAAGSGVRAPNPPPAGAVKLPPPPPPRKR